MRSKVFLLAIFPLVIRGQPECSCTTSSPMVQTEQEIRALEKAVFEPISVRRIFDMSSFTVTYISDIRGPDDAVSEFNGTVRRVYDGGNNPILEARLTVPAIEVMHDHPIAFILSSESTSSSFVMDINRTRMATKQTDFIGTKCYFRISSTTVGNIFHYNAYTTCPDQLHASSYFKTTLSQRGKGMLSFQETEELKERSYYNFSSSVDGERASFSMNPVEMLANGIKLESLKFQLVALSKNENDLVAFNVWSYDIV